MFLKVQGFYNVIMQKPLRYNTMTDPETSIVNLCALVRMIMLHYAVSTKQHMRFYCQNRVCSFVDKPVYAVLWLKQHMRNFTKTASCLDLQTVF